MLPSSESARLLVVDDNSENRVTLARSLELQGHLVDTAENGKEGLEKFRTGAFDLMLKPARLAPATAP